MLYRIHETIYLKGKLFIGNGCPITLHFTLRKYLIYTDILLVHFQSEG